MPGSLADYLAKNYLNADPTTERPKKKRKKTKSAPTDDASNGLIIADDDPPDLRNMTTNIGQDDEYSPAIDTSTKSAEFRRSKKSGWKTVGGPTDTEQAAADAILASAAAERTAREDGEDEEAPTVEEQDDDEGGGPKMESGARGGLQTAAQTAAMVKAQEKKKKAEMAKYQDPAFADATSQETIYRDASGRIINVAMKRAEARRAEEEKIKKEAAEREAAMGDVQRQQRASRKQELEEIKSMPVARTIDDEDLNDDLRSKERWNDPAAGFLTQKAKPGASVTGRPLYRGSFQPNRYGIRPGHRWDGVDRANGFEKEWFASRNKRDRMEALEYQWQMDE